MTLATRLTLAMTGLVLLTATALGLLAFRNAEISMQLAGLAAVAAALLLAVLAARALTRPLARMAHAAGTMSIDSKPMTRISESGEIGRLARAFDRLADEMRDRSAQLEHESSKRRTTEAELEQYRQQERMFAAAVESANYPVITKTLDGTITAWNPAAARLYQYPVSEAIGRNIAFIVPPDRRSEHSEIVKRVLAAEPIESFETVRVARDGRRIDVSLSFYPIKSSSGEIVALAAITRDITAQKSAEEKFRLAVESCPSGMVMVDRTGRIVMVNTEVERLFAYQRDELIGQPIEILVPERFHAEHVSDRDAFATAPENRRMGAERKLFGRRKDGVEIPVEVSLNPIHTREGVLILSVIVDVSERQRAQELFRLAVEACPSGMVMIDRTGRIVMVNTEIERLFGYRRDELIGMPVETLVPPRLRSHHVDHRTGFTGRPETRRMGGGRDLFGFRKDGTEFPVEVGLNPIHVGESLLVLSVIVDISERKRLERLKNEFVSTVSHELRTPLTSIAGSLGLLLGGAAGALPDPIARLLKIAQANSQRLVRLINDILDIEKIESGRVVFNFKRVELRSLVEQTIEANRGFAEGYNVRVQLKAPPGAEVHADPDRLAQVVTNLLSNAIKFSSAGGEVVVAIEKQSPNVRLMVRDHGPGISASFKQHVFEKFAQADATDARQKGGTGLGLSIVQQIVQRLGGEVGFDDAPGGGSIFHVELPDWEQVARREIDPESEPGDARILLCEDDSSTAMAVRRRLRERGFATDFAHTRGDASARAAADRYAAIVVDLQLPDGNGIGLVRDLREQPHNYKTPIVVLSEDLAGAGLTTPKLNVLQLLGKPLDIERLVWTLDAAIARGGDGRPQILHVDDDRDVLALVAEALGSTANLVSVDSVTAARRALAAQRFDLAVLDVTLGADSGLDLLPELYDAAGAAIPVIVFSAHGADLACDRQVQATLNKSPASIERLVSAVHDRLTLQCSRTSEEVA